MRAAVPLVSKNPTDPPRVVVVGRVSTDKQPESNIEAGYDYTSRMVPGSISPGIASFKSLANERISVLRFIICTTLWLTLVVRLAWTLPNSAPQVMRSDRSFADRRKRSSHCG